MINKNKNKRLNIHINETPKQSTNQKKDMNQNVKFSKVSRVRTQNS